MNMLTDYIKYKISIKNLEYIINTEDGIFRKWYSRKLKAGIRKFMNMTKIRFRWFGFYKSPKYSDECDAEDAFMKTLEGKTLKAMKFGHHVRMEILRRRINQRYQDKADIVFTMSEIRELELEKYEVKMLFTPA